MPAKTLMIQGTMSSAGKSLLVTALCRILARRGVRVAPFKAQNMSNNAAVCVDGGEIGRAQFTQAQAAGVVPTVDMNPILLKPEADARSQVIVMGRRWQTVVAKSYYERKAELWQYVTAALDHLREQYELVILEGAGSPVELNLKQGDLVNMAVARYLSAPVLLVGDIDRGGIFAQLLGTLALLEDDERALVRGMIVNKFRGDPDLFRDGVTMLEQRGGVPVLGVIPYLRHHAIPEEDAVAIEEVPGSVEPRAQIDIAVIRLPRIANFDDFDPLAAEPGVNVRYVSDAAGLGQPDAIILPGTKSTIADLEWLRARHLDSAIQRLATSTPVVGICGGYQILGAFIYDPDHVESERVTAVGLNLLPIETTFTFLKSTFQVNAVVNNGMSWLDPLAGTTISGYELHSGYTEHVQGWLTICERGGGPADVADGAFSADGRIWGCYIHGLFANTEFRHAWLRSLGWRETTAPVRTASTAFDALADHVEAALDMDLLQEIIGL